MPERIVLGWQILELYFWPMHRCILDFCLFLGPSPPPPNGLKKNPLQSSHARDMITFIVM